MTGPERLRAAMVNWPNIPYEQRIGVIEASMESLWHRDVVVNGSPEWDQTDLSGPFAGHAELLEFWRTWLASWGALDFDLVDWIDEGKRTFMVLDQRMRGRASDIEIRTPYVWAITWCDDRIWRLQFATSLEEARALVAAEPAS